MEQIIRATLRDALRARCKQRNNLADDGSPMGASIDWELPENSAAIEHPRDTAAAVLSNEAGAPVRNVPFAKKDTRKGRQAAFVLKDKAS